MSECKLYYNNNPIDLNLNLDVNTLAAFLKGPEAEIYRTILKDYVDLDLKLTSEETYQDKLPELKDIINIESSNHSELLKINNDRYTFNPEALDENSNLIDLAPLVYLNSNLDFKSELVQYPELISEELTKNTYTKLIEASTLGKIFTNKLSLGLEYTNDLVDEFNKVFNLKLNTLSDLINTSLYDIIKYPKKLTKQAISKASSKKAYKEINELLDIKIKDTNSLEYSLNENKQELLDQANEDTYDLVKNIPDEYLDNFTIEYEELDEVIHQWNGSAIEPISKIY